MLAEPDADGSNDALDDDPDVPELTRVERALLDYPVTRDVVLFTFLAGSFGGGMWLLPGVPVPATWAVGMGVAFAIGWLALMELYARRQGTSMLRSVGTDPYAPLLDDRD